MMAYNWPSQIPQKVVEIMSERIQTGGLQIAKTLHDLVANEICPGTGISAETVWQSLEAILQDLAPENQALLDKRDDFQAQIDDWHKQPDNRPLNPALYKAFLQDIGYLLPEGEDFSVSTSNVDPEIAREGYFPPG